MRWRETVDQEVSAYLVVPQYGLAGGIGRSGMQHLPILNIMPTILNADLIVLAAVPPVLVFHEMSVREVTTWRATHVPLSDKPVIPFAIRIMGAMPTRSRPRCRACFPPHKGS